MATHSEPSGSAGEPDRSPIFASVGERRRRLSGVAILALTIALLVGVLVVVLANAGL
jgi:hypothetical protein